MLPAGVVRLERGPSACAGGGREQVRGDGERSLDGDEASVSWVCGDGFRCGLDVGEFGAVDGDVDGGVVGLDDGGDAGGGVLCGWLVICRPSCRPSCRAMVVSVFMRLLGVRFGWGVPV